MEIEMTEGVCPPACFSLTFSITHKRNKHIKLTDDRRLFFIVFFLFICCSSFLFSFPTYESVCGLTEKGILCLTS